MGSLEEFRQICAEIIARLEENESADWWRDVDFLTRRLEQARKGLALGWPPQRTLGDNPALLIVHLQRGWELSPEPEAAHLVFVRHTAGKCEEGTFLLSRDPERVSCSSSLVEGWFRTAEGLVRNGEARLRALKTARQWLRTAERAAETLPGPRVHQSPGTDDNDLISEQHPESNQYRYKKQWCTVEWAKERYDLNQSSISKAHRGKIYGCTISPPRIALVNSRKLQVFKFDDLEKLANARIRANGD